MRAIGIRSVALGAHIRHLRGELGLSLVAAGKLAAFSKSSLQRMERGERDVTPEEVAQLEVALGLGGRLSGEYYREVLAYAAEHLKPAALWIHAYPAKWAGTVWASICTSAEVRRVRASIVWGSWSRPVEVEVSGQPLTLVFGKGSDGESIPLALTVEPDCVVSFGFGPPVTDAFLDINEGWIYGANESEALRRVGASFHHMLSRQGRTIADLAELLGASEQELRAVLQLIEDRPL